MFANIVVAALLLVSPFLAWACWTGRYKESWLTEGSGYSSQVAAGAQAATVPLPALVLSFALVAPPEWLVQWATGRWGIVSTIALFTGVLIVVMMLLLFARLRPRFLVPPRLRDRQSIREQRNAERARPDASE